LSLAATLTLSDRPTEALAVLDDLEARPISPSVRYAAAQHRLLGVMRSGNVDALAANVAALADLPSDSTASCDDDVVIPFARDRFFHHFAGTAAYLDGDLPAARDAYERAAMNREATDFLYCQSVGALARVMYGTGELDDADRLAKESLRRQVELGIGETVVVLPAYHALGDVAWERNQLDDAEEYLARARRAVQPLWWEMVRVQASASRVLASRGELDEARAGLLECGQTYLDGTGSTRLHAVLCEHAVALALRASDIDEARKWVQARAMYTDRPLKISLQLRMSASETTRLDSIGLDEALVVKQPLPDRLDTLLAAATVVGCVGDDGRCDDLVAQALRLAAPGGFVVRFVDASRQVHAAVRNIASTGPAEQEPTAVDPFFVATVLAALDENLATGRRANTHSTELFEQLTERELEVLDLLVAEESYRTIGSKLFVSRNTVKSHVRHIYQKLGVGDRDAAVEKARQLELA
jgi:LuxR family maltose regulon positive regulatory protein